MSLEVHLADRIERVQLAVISNSPTTPEAIQLWNLAEFPEMTGYKKNPPHEMPGGTVTGIGPYGIVNLTTSPGRADLFMNGPSERAGVNGVPWLEEEEIRAFLSPRIADYLTGLNYRMPIGRIAFVMECALQTYSTAENISTLRNMLPGISYLSEENTLDFSFQLNRQSTYPHPNLTMNRLVTWQSNVGQRIEVNLTPSVMAHQTNVVETFAVTYRVDVNSAFSEVPLQVQDAASIAEASITEAFRFRPDPLRQLGFHP